MKSSLATQEDSNLANASTSVAAIPSEDDGDEDEEMILQCMGMLIQLF